MLRLLTPALGELNDQHRFLAARPISHDETVEN